MPLNRQSFIRELFESLALAGFQFRGEDLDWEEFSSGGTEPKVLILRKSNEISSGSGSVVSSYVVPLSAEISLENHGHCAALGLNGRRMVELELISSEACAISVHALAGGRQDLVLRCRPGTTVLQVRFEDFEIVDRGVGDSAGEWISNPGDRDLWYLMDRALTPSGEKKLLVVFSAIGDPYDFTYNYRAGLNETDVNRLFILDDFGARGSYYWMDHRETSIFESVQGLIRQIADSLQIPTFEIILAGSSKGGTAALLHGVSLGVKEVWAGAPQYGVGDYLYEADNSILNFMTGGTGDSDRSWLNERVRQILLMGNRNTRIQVVVGSKDHHLNNHVMPLKSDAESFGYQCDVLEVTGFPHSQIGKVFTHFLSAKSFSLGSNENIQMLPYSCAWAEGSIVFLCWAAEQVSLCVDMYSTEGLVTRIPYVKSSEFIFSLSGITSSVRFRVYQKHDDRETIDAFTTKWSTRRAHINL